VLIRLEPVPGAGEEAREMRLFAPEDSALAGRLSAALAALDAAPGEGARA
jgi:hypothetical protein